MRSFFSALLCITVFVVTANAQTPTECEELFKKVTDKVRSMRMMSAKSAFEMTVHATATPEKGSAVHDRMEVVMLGDKYRYQTNDFRLYQDKKTTVVIQNDSKNIFLTSAMSQKNRQTQLGKMMELQDSLQEHLVLRECGREFGTIQVDAGYTKIVFVPGKKLEGLGLKSISYWVDAHTLDVKKIAIDYTPGSAYGMKRYELVIEKMNARSTTVPFPGEALAQVMPGGKLKNELKDYEIIDKRN